MNRAKKIFSFMLTLILVLGEFAGLGIKAEAYSKYTDMGNIPEVVASASFVGPELNDEVKNIEYKLVSPTYHYVTVSFAGWYRENQYGDYVYYDKKVFGPGSYKPFVRVRSETGSGFYYDKYFKLKKDTVLKVGTVEYKFESINDLYDSYGYGYSFYSGPEFYIKDVEAFKSIDVINDGHGSAYADTALANPGVYVTLTSKPKDGYIFKEWQVISGGVNMEGNRFKILTEDIVIKAIFEPKYHEVGTVGEITATSNYLDPKIGEKVGKPLVTITEPTDKGLKVNKTVWCRVEGNRDIECKQTDVFEEGKTYRLWCQIDSRGIEVASSGLCDYYTITEDTTLEVNDTKWKGETAYDHFKDMGYATKWFYGPKVTAVDKRPISGTVFYKSLLKAGEPAELGYTGKIADASANGKKLYYKWQRASSENGPWTDVVGGDIAAYVPTAFDIDKYLRVSVTAEGFEGSVAAPARHIEKLPNKEKPVHALLETEAPYNRVTVTNARAGQEYLIKSLGLGQNQSWTVNTRDWSDAVAVTQDCAFQFGCEADKYVYVYTRYAETGTTSAGEKIDESRINTMNEVWMTDLRVDKEKMEISKGGVEVLSVYPVPENANYFPGYGLGTWDDITVNWINNEESVQLFANEEGTPYEPDNEAHKKLKTIYIKGVKPDNHVEIIAEKTWGVSDVARAVGIVTVQDEDGTVPLYDLWFAGVTVRPGDTDVAIEFSRDPVNGKLDNMLIGPEVNTNPKISFKRGEGDYILADIPEDAPNGEYVYRAIYMADVNGELQNRHSKFSISVNNTYASVQNMRLSMEQYTAEQGEEFCLSAYDVPTDMVRWTIAGVSANVATVNDGIVSVNQTAEEGTEFVVRAKAGNLIRNCKVKVCNPKMVIVDDSYAEEPGTGRYREGDTVNISAGVNENFVFNGWDCEDGLIWYESGADASFRMPDHDVELRAVWAEPWTTFTTYTVSFNMCGKAATNVPRNQVVSENGFAVRPETDPEAEGYVFADWYADEECTTVFDFEKTPIVKKTTIYAGWTEAENNILPGASEEDDSVWNLFEDAGEHIYKLKGTNAETEIKNSNSKSSVYYDAVLKGDEIVVKLIGERKAAAKAANSVLEFNMGAAGVLEYTLPVQYVKPVFKLSKKTVPIVGGTVYTTLLKKTGNGSFVPYEAEKDSVSISGEAKISVSANGKLRAEVPAKGKYKISVKKAGWDGSIDLSMKAAKSTDLYVDLGDTKTIVLNTHAKEQVFTYDCYAKGVPAAAGSVEIKDSRKSGLVKVENGKVIVAFPSAEIKKGTYQITLSVGKDKVKLKVKVSDKELKNSVGFKVISRLDVVTGQSMIMKPVFKEAGGKISSVSVNEAGYAVSVNSAGDIVVAYAGTGLTAKKPVIGSLTIKMIVEGIADPFECTTAKLKAKKSSPKVRAAAVVMPADQSPGATVIVSTYKDGSGKLRALEPETVEITQKKKVEAVVDGLDKTRINVTGLAAKSGTVKLKLTFRGEYEKKLSVKVKAGKTTK